MTTYNPAIGKIISILQKQKKELRKDNGEEVGRRVDGGRLPGLPACEGGGGWCTDVGVEGGGLLGGRTFLGG